MEKSEFIKEMKQATDIVEELITVAEENNFTNEQEFLNFLDGLNKLSIKY